MNAFCARSEASTDGPLSRKNMFSRIQMEKSLNHYQAHAPLTGSNTSPSEVAFVTLTNQGYVPLTLNCLQSLKRIGCQEKLVCFCIGQGAYSELQNHGHACELIDDEVNTNFQIFRQGNWSNITFYKFEVIHKCLKSKRFVLFTDGDIVFEKNGFMEYLIDQIEDNDLLIQHDHDSSTGLSDLCSGFMLIASSPKTLELFDPCNMTQFRSQVGWDDQVYVNAIKHQLNVKVLPDELFPCGAVFYKTPEMRPYMIHFNHVIGHDKKGRMQRHGRWYI